MDDSYFHGINKMKKPGFKVIKPPGGQTNINIFEQSHEVNSSPINPCQAERNSSNVFSVPDPTPVKSNADRNSSSIVFGGPEPPAPQPVNQSAGDTTAPSVNHTAPVNQTAPVNHTAPTNVPEKTSPNELLKPDSKKDTNSNTRCSEKPPKNNNTTDNSNYIRSSTKVIAPPGGKSSINLFG